MEPSEEKKKSILIVEDDTSLLRGLIDKFTREHFAVFFASNGIEGLSSAFLHRPDVILLDIIMPEMDGLTMLQKLREKNDWGKKVPVVFLTNLSADSDRVIARISQDEPAFYLLKSDFLLSDVVAKVCEAMKASSTLSGNA